MMKFVLKTLVGVLGLLPLVNLANASAPAPSIQTSSSALLFESVRPALAGLRTLVRATGKQYVAGSAFMVDGQGHAITNFHVVADAILDPQSYTLEFRSSDGVTGKAKVLAVDAINDLAVVTLDGKQKSSLDLARWRPTQQLGKGASLHSIGNPLDLGFTVTNGSYSGLVGASVIGRIHYSGVLNPGMSGGPALDDSGRLVGVNVSKNLNGEMVSFLVPIERARELYSRALSDPPLAENQAREEVTRQLVAHQQGIVDMALAQPWKSVSYGPYHAPEILADISDCGSTSNHNPVAPPAVQAQTSRCQIKETASVPGGLAGGAMIYRNTYLESRTLNSLLFSRHVDTELRRDLLGPTSALRGRQLCQDDFVAAGEAGKLPVRLVWCTQAFRGYPGLYDFDVSVTTQDRSKQALVTRLALNGFTWENGQRLTRRLLENLK